MRRHENTVVLFRAFFHVEIGHSTDPLFGLFNVKNPLIWMKTIDIKRYNRKNGKNERFIGTAEGVGEQE